MYKLPRKTKKKFKKWLYSKSSENYNIWAYKLFKYGSYHKIVNDYISIKVLLKYPEIATKEEIINFYENNYSDDNNEKRINYIRNNIS